MSSSCSKRLMRYRWELEMKNNYMMLPLVLAGVIGGVYFFQMRVISDIVRPEPKKARAQIQPAESAPPQKDGRQKIAEN